MKRHRVYWNHAAAKPLVWSVDAGDHSTEVNVEAVVVDAGAVTTKVNLEAVWPEPKGWLEVYGSLAIIGGVAYLR